MLVSFLVLEPMVSWYVLVGSCVICVTAFLSNADPTDQVPSTALYLTAYAYSYTSSTQLMTQLRSDLRFTQRGSA